MFTRSWLVVVLFAIVAAMQISGVNEASAQVTVVVHKTQKIGHAYGGDGGPGTGDPTIGVATSFNWSLPLSSIVPPGTKKSEKTLILNTMTNVMIVIGSASMVAAESVPLDAAGDYDGSTISVAGTGLGTSAPNPAQLQILGSNIDLSGVDQLNYAAISSLPVGTYTAEPVSQVTSKHLTFIIKE